MQKHAGQAEKTCCAHRLDAVPPSSEPVNSQPLLRATLGLLPSCSPSSCCTRARAAVKRASPGCSSSPSRSADSASTRRSSSSSASPCSGRIGALCGETNRHDNLYTHICVCVHACMHTCAYFMFMCIYAYTWRVMHSHDASPHASYLEGNQVR
jgi:hypothetical protein